MTGVSLSLFVSWLEDFHARWNGTVQLLRITHLSDNWWG